MDFSLTTFLVVPVGNTLPTTGGPQDMTDNQVGVFRPDYTPATAGNIAAADYIYIKQMPEIKEPGLGTIGSDKIYAEEIVEWYKVPSDEGFANQITEFSNFQMKYNTNYTLTLRLFSNYTGVGYFNGMTRSVTVMTPCLECGDDPCTPLSAADTQAAVQNMVDDINADQLLSQLVVAELIGTGATSKIRITGKALPENRTGQNPWLGRFSFDRLYFFGWVYEAAETTQDNILYYETCEPVATGTVLQRAMWPRGTAAEIAELEKQYHSYKTVYGKQLFADSDWNVTFNSLVDPAEFYTTYLLRFNQHRPTLAWRNAMHIDETIFLAIPTGETAAFEALMTAFAGAPENKDGANISTTTTTSTTSTSTTSTTTLTP